MSFIFYSFDVRLSNFPKSILFCHSPARPESPTIVAVETSVSDAVVRWKFGDDGGLELIALKLQYQETSESTWHEIQITPPKKDKYTIMDLKPDTNYKFRILATNSLGTSPPSSVFMAKTSKSGR